MIVALLAPAVGVAGCPADSAADPRLARVPAATRIAYLRHRLDAARPASERWSGAWGLVDGAFALGQLIALPATADRGERAVFAAGAAVSALGVVQLLVLPIMPPRTPGAGDECATLAALEAALARGARNQALGAGPVAHVGNVLVNALLGVLAAVAGSKSSGLLTAGVGWALGEAQLLTQPTSLVRDLERYREGDLSPPGAAVRLRLGARGGAVVAVELSF